MREFLQHNWFWILLLVGFVWMHASGRGCCGGHGGHGGGHGGHGGHRDLPDRPRGP